MSLTAKHSPKTSYSQKTDTIKQTQDNKTVHENWQQIERSNLNLYFYFLNLRWFII